MERPASELSPNLIEEAKETLRQERPPSLPALVDGELAPTPIGDTSFFIAGPSDYRVKALGTITENGKTYKIGPLADKLYN